MVLSVILSLLFSFIIKILISFFMAYIMNFIPLIFFPKNKREKGALSRTRTHLNIDNPLFLRWDTFERLLPYSHNLTLHLYDYRSYCDPVRGKTRFYRISNIVRSDDEYCSFRTCTYRDTGKLEMRTNILHHIEFETSWII